MGGISVWQLLIVAVIVVLLFGTKKLRNLGGDLGSAIKGFKNAIGDDKSSSVDSLSDKPSDDIEKTNSIKSEVKDKDKDQA